MKHSSTESHTLSGLLGTSAILSVLTNRSNELAKLTGEYCLVANELERALIVSNSDLLNNALSLILKEINPKVNNTLLAVDSFIESDSDLVKDHDVIVIICHDADTLNKLLKVESGEGSKRFLIAPSTQQLPSLTEMGVNTAIALESNPSDIRDALLRGLGGEKFSIGFTNSLEEKYPDLTRRQKDVLLLMRAGKSNKEIARDLNIALSTIKTHCAAIFKELGVMNRTQAVLLLG